MKQFVLRGMVAFGLVTSLGLGISAVASAGGTPGGTTTTSAVLSAAQKLYHQQLSAYRASRGAIESTFRASVETARSTYEKALLTSTTSAERSAAEQNKETAIIEAAGARTAALIALGNAPTPPAA